MAQPKCFLKNLLQGLLQVFYLLDRKILLTNLMTMINKIDNFADIILDNIRQNTRIDLSDGLDKEELFQGLKDLSTQQQSSQD
jgi:hypothetical protein